MDTKKTVRFSFFTMSVFAVLILALWSDKGVSVHIQNNTESELNDIILEFTGGKKIISRLTSGKTVVKLISPAGESSLSVSYMIGDKNYKQRLDIYIEPDYKGHLFIFIKDNGEIIYDSKGISL